MDNTIKPFTLLLLLTILICGLFLHVLANCSVVQASDVSDIPNPSVPEFTVKLVAYPYDVPSTTTTKIDPYTGEETVITTPAYRVENRSIEIAIKNQPFTPYTDDWKDINLYYGVRVKGHFGEDWEELYSRYKSNPEAHPVQSSSEYTVLSLPANYPEGGQVDFQVRAILGYYYDELAGRPILPLYVLGSVGSSGWSSTQTLTIDWNTTITVDEPTSSDDATIPDNAITSEDTTIAITVISVAALAIGLFVYFKIRKN
jgi:hypothetical protein